MSNNKIKAGDIIFSRKKNPFSWIIRKWTHSKWSHVRIAINSREYVSAQFPRVKCGFIDGIKEEYEVMTPAIPLTKIQAKYLVLYVASKIGKRYDLRGILSFIICRSIGRKSAYFCAELVSEAYVMAGKPLLRRDPSWVTPQDIYQSNDIMEVDL